jgi:hypothetical protein
MVDWGGMLCHHNDVSGLESYGLEGKHVGEPRDTDMQGWMTSKAKRGDDLSQAPSGARRDTDHQPHKELYAQEVRT